jgi:hypothetical protein
MFGCRPRTCIGVVRSGCVITLDESCVICMTGYSACRHMDSEHTLDQMRHWFCNLASSSSPAVGSDLFPLSSFPSLRPEAFWYLHNRAGTDTTKWGNYPTRRLGGCKCR